MSDHFLRLEGARTLSTPDFRLAQRVVGNLAGLRAMGAVYGEAGLGKTYAVSAALGELAITTCQMVFPLHTTPKRLLTELLELVTGVTHSGTQAQLEPLLIEALSELRRLISIDEAQHLNYACVEYLRHLHDHPETKFGLVLVGGNGCWELLSRYPMLRSRIHQRVKFRPLEPDRVVELLPRFHPIYEDADPELVRMVNDVLAHGNLRNWVSFTKSALGLMQEHGLKRLTEDVTRNVFALNGGAPDA